MTNYIKIAKQYSKAGFIVIPVSSLKTPTIKNWTNIKKPFTDEECENLFKETYGIGLVMGGEKRLTTIDIDLKNVLDSSFFESYKKALGTKLLKKFYIQKTRNNGYHFTFSCSIVEGNMKLASRAVTPEERHEIYLENYKDLRTRGLALKLASNHKSVVTCETRGEGGFIVLAPTPGYEKVCGKIQEITLEEYNTIMTISRSFSECDDVFTDFRIEKYRNRDVDPFQNFNERGDSVSILESNGWIIVGESNKNIRFKRPGDSSPSSAIYDKTTKVFRNYSTSAPGLEARAYSPSSLFVILMCDNDVSLANTRLLQMGYGEKV